MRHMLKEMVKRRPESKDGKLAVSAIDFMDDGSQLKLTMTVDGGSGEAVFDFTGTDPEMYGNSNAPRAITYSAIIYCLRCLVNADIPLN